MEESDIEFHTESESVFVLESVSDSDSEYENVFETQSEIES